MSKKKEVYIPIEIKPREFVSQIFLAGKLAKKRARVFIGSKSSIDYMIHNKYHFEGVYLYKGGGSTSEKFKNLSKKVRSIVVMDQEVTPTLFSYKYIRTRFVGDTLKYVSRLYYVGPKAKQSAIKLLKHISPDKIKDFGWPKIDLWKPSMHHVSMDYVKKIHSEFSENFILFSSDFGINSKKLLEERSIRYELVGEKKTIEELENMRENFEVSYQKFIQFLNFLKEIDSDSRIPLIIVRPHPSEDISIWEEKIAKFKKIKVIYEGDITPWLLASNGLLHRGCTTSLQAYISEKKSGYLKNFANENKTDTIAPQLSHELKSIEDIRDWIKNRSFKFISNKNILSDVITLSEKGATEAMAEDMILLAGNEVNSSKIKKKTIFAKILQKIFTVVKKISNKKNPYELGNLPTYNKMQDGIKFAEVQNHLLHMYPEDKFYIKELIKDLCVIELKK